MTPSTPGRADGAGPGGDTGLAARIRAGDLVALRRHVERDHAIAAFVGAAFGVADVDGAWERHVARVTAGEVRDELRKELLASVYAGREPDGPGEPLVRLGATAPEDDRWAGWWRSAPPPWPAEPDLSPSVVLAALRRMPGHLRALLVLRDVAGLDIRDAAAVASAAGGGPRIDPADALEDARDAYLVAIDQEVGRVGSA